MLPEKTKAVMVNVPETFANAQEYEDALVALFAARIKAIGIGPLSQASPALQARLLEMVKTLARYLDMSGESGSPTGYARRVLYEEPEHWSLAVIILRPGQQTQAHDHGGWGCAVTVQGLERDRRFIYDEFGRLDLRSELDYSPGTGYIFDAKVVHQPFGADPQQVTVALHFLVHHIHSEKP